MTSIASSDMWQDARSALLSDDDASEMSAVLASLLLVLRSASTSDGQMLGPAAPGASRQQHDGPLRHPRPHDWMTKCCLLPRLGALLYQVRSFLGLLDGPTAVVVRRRASRREEGNCPFFLPSLKPSWSESLFNTTTRYFNPRMDGVGTLWTDLSLSNPGCFIGSCKAHPGLLRMASFSKQRVPSTIFTV